MSETSGINNADYQWYALRDLKRANAKHLAWEVLTEKGFEVFTPMHWKLISNKSGRKTRVRVPVGALPPNPAELLLTPRFKTLIEQAKQEYDYVFIDCPPVEVVADAAIINPIVDLTLFVVRTGNLERAYLADIERWYQEGKYRNMAILLNGTEAAGKYGYHRHGYGYGCGYGYGNR